MKCLINRVLRAVAIGKRRQTDESLPGTNASGGIQSESQQRQAIMAHAALVNSSSSAKPVRTRTGGKPFIKKAANEASYNTAPVEEQGYSSSDSRETAAAKQAIMQQAAAQNQNNSLLGQLHAERLARQQLGVSSSQPAEKASASLPAAASSPTLAELKLLTYNVW